MSSLLERYSQIKKGQKVAILSLITLWLLYEGYTIKIVTAQENLQAAHAEASQLDQQIIEMKELTQSMATIQEEHRRADEEMASLRAVIPDEPEIEQLLSSFSSAARQAGVRIEGFQPESINQNQSGYAGLPEVQAAAQSSDDESGLNQPSAAPEEIQAPVAYPTRVKVAITGKFGQIVSFLDRSLTFGRILHLTEIEISKNGALNTETTGVQRSLQATATFLAFAQRSVEYKSSDPSPNNPGQPSNSGALPSAENMQESVDRLAKNTTNTHLED
jgi:Tfp pilus assembly protein PilO